MDSDFARDPSVSERAAHSGRRNAICKLQNTNCELQITDRTLRDVWPLATDHRPPPPAGITLVELLTAMTITAIIAGVLVGVGVKAVAVATNTVMVAEVAQLNNAVEAFFEHFGAYPPDFHDPEQLQGFLETAFPKCPPEKYPDFGDQSPASALCYWLQGPNGDGFSTDPTNPFAEGGPRFSPIIQLDPARVQTVSGATLYYPPRVPIDRSSPYVYFCGSQKGYEGHPGWSPARPYRYSRDGSWINHNSFQVLCAGADGIFGSGNHFPSGSDFDQYNHDDISNFSGGGTMKQAIPETPEED